MYLRLALFIAVSWVLSTTLFAHPGSGIVVDRLGQIYFLDTGSGLWRIDTGGGLAHLSTLRNHWLALDPENGFDQSRLPTDSGHDWIITAVGSGPTLLISTDFPLVIGQGGDLYYPSVRERSVRLLRTKRAGATSTYVTLPRSVAGAPLGWINGIATGPDDNIYYTEDNAIRRITPRGVVSTVKIIPKLTNGPAVPGNQKHPYLRGLKVDTTGNVFVADSGDARVLKITPDGKISTLVQLESPWAPTDVAIFGDTLYVLEFLHTAEDDRLQWMPRIRKITPEGRSTVILTVDKMPGARTPRPTASVSQTVPSLLFWELLFRSVFLDI
ncbi:MAG TPA: SMP-30/gluconolactonase/LRE family protein [Pyrinomonadaceae bacterium]|jgi:sugar lactone lactonase YvrE|nr:SMP-30/gluconolactonase/LRE family protein [Pyrinomonadaceae bacterium]